MTDLLTRPESESRVSTPATRRRTFLRILIALFGVAAILVIPLRNLFVSRYQPISVGNGAYALEIRGPREDGVVRYDTWDFNPGEIVVIPFQNGGSLRMVFPIFHQGDRAIRITHLDRGFGPPEFVTVLDPVGVERGSLPARNPTLERSMRPFTPFVLEPEDNSLIGFRYDFVCQRPGSSTEIRDSFELRFEMFGASRWVRLPLPWRLVLESPTKEDCPPGSAVSR